MTQHKLPIRSDADRATARKWVDRVPKGWTIVFKPPTRSLDQNARLWAFLDDIAAQKEWAGKKRSSEAWKDLFSAALRQQEIVPNLDNNGFVAFGARTSEMSPEEMSDLLQLIETWGAENGVVFSDVPASVSAKPGAGNKREPEQQGLGASGSRGHSGGTQ